MRNMKFHGSKTEKMEHPQKSDITFETDFRCRIGLILISFFYGFLMFIYIVIILVNVFDNNKNNNYYHIIFVTDYCPFFLLFYYLFFLIFNSSWRQKTLKQREHKRQVKHKKEQIINNTKFRSTTVNTSTK